MTSQLLEMERSRSRDALIMTQRGELLMAGDRVTIAAEDLRVYRIIHVSHRKAWVSPLLDGRPRIIQTGDLRLVHGECASGSMLN